MKKILITSGGTIEHIDDVRVLTNISTGKLGSLIADEFLMANKNGQKHPPIYRPQLINYEVHYVCTKATKIPFTMTAWWNAGFVCHYVTDVQSLYNKMEELIPQMDVVIHAMAVSDFAFKPLSTKLKSNDPDAFIESMHERIYKTPKIISKIKEWNPNCILIGFKFEVGVNKYTMAELATNQILSCKSDAVLTNDKKEMQEKNSHVAKLYFLDNHKLSWIDYEDKNDIAKGIFNFIENKLEIS